jgi:predicted Rdx family selenoprotein
LRSGRSGQFDIVIDGKVAYSRNRTGRFPTDAEVQALAPQG